MFDMNERSASGAKRTDLVAELNDAIRRNPLPAALIGAGVLWLFMGGTKYAGIRSASRSLVRGIGQGVQFAGEATSQGVGTAARGVAQGVAELSSQAREAASASANALGAAGKTVATSLQEKAAAATGVVDGVTAYVQSATSSSRGSGSGSISQASTGSVQRSLAELFDHQPLTLGLVGIAVGAALAASMPTTDMEQNVMGAAAGALKAQAGRSWDDAAKQAQDAAKRVADVAKSEGLTPDAATEAAGQMSDKIQGFVSKTIR